MSRPSASDNLAHNLETEKTTNAASSSSSAPTAYDISKRAVRSTRTPLNWATSTTNSQATKSKPSRSQTAPLQPEGSSNVGKGTRRPNVRAPTVPAPKSNRQRYDSSNSVDADADRSFLSIPDSQNQNRQSTVSSQHTDPSSYYSAESNASFPRDANVNANTSGSDASSPNFPIPNFRPPAMPTPSIPPLPTNVRQSSSTGHSMPEPSRQSTSDSTAYANYPTWLINSVNAPAMPTLEIHTEAMEESISGREGEIDQRQDNRDNASDEWDDDDSQSDDDRWQMPLPEHQQDHPTQRWSLGDEEGLAALGLDAPPTMPEAEHHRTMPIPTLHLQHDDVTQAHLDDIQEENAALESTIRMPSHPNLHPHTLSHPTMPTTPSTSQGSRPTLSLNTPPSPTAGRRPYGSIHIPPPPKTPPPLPSPDRTNPEVGLAVGGLWNSPVGAHAPPLPVPQPAGGAGTAPLKIHHHTKPPTQPQGHPKPPTQPQVGSSNRPTHKPTPSNPSVTTSPNSRIEKPNTTSVAGTIPTPASSRPNTNTFTQGSTTAQKPSTTNANATYPPTQTQSTITPATTNTNAITGTTNSGGRPSISGPQPMKISTSTSSQGQSSKPTTHFNEKINTAPSSSGHGHAETQTHASSTAPLAGTSNPTRPHLLHGTPSQMDTQYVNMLLALDDIPTTHNWAASFFNWILLAGFILFPGTFQSLQALSSANGGEVPEGFVHAVQQLPLYIVAWVCCAIGASGMIYLTFRWRKNYIWALNKIFAPGLMNSLAGLLSTIASVYGAQNGVLTVTSKSTLVITAASSVVFLVFTGVYSLWLVRRVKSRHDKEVGIQRTGKYGEGVVDMTKRRAQMV